MILFLIIGTSKMVRAVMVLSSLLQMLEFFQQGRLQLSHSVRHPSAMDWSHSDNVAPLR